MAFLTQERLEEIAEVVLLRVPYNENTRNQFFASIDPAYKNMLPGSLAIPQMQIMSDLNELNKTEKLTDGTIPFQLWLRNATSFLKPFVENKIIQQALNDISKEATKAEPLTTAPPDKDTIDRIVEEKIMGENDMLNYTFLEGGYLAGISVGLVLVPQYYNGKAKTIPGKGPSLSRGTGWLLSKDLVITNHHVINARAKKEPNASEGDFKLQGDNAAILFDYNAEDAAGTRIKSAKLEAANKELDFAIFRLATPVEREALRLFPVEVKLNKEHPQPVNIIQHPGGKEKKVAIRNNHIYEATYPKVTYYTDTEGGASGSAVFDDDWFVVALHRASVNVAADNNKTNTAGENKNGAKENGEKEKVSWINEGVQIKAIVDYLKQNHAELAAELTLIENP